MLEFAGKVALVTGAARGIGAAVAEAFAKAGADVACQDVADCSGTAERVRQLGRRALAVSSDVATPEAMAQFVHAATAQLGHVDVFVANAAFSERGPFHELPLEKFARTIDVTMWGVFHGVKAATVQMIRQGKGGAIVVIGSPHARFAVPLSMPYNMAKAAVDHMARTAAAELCPQRIRVNIVHPGWVDTPGERKFYTDAEIAERAKSLPLGRLCRPDEIARCVLFLAADASAYITGATLTCDGGLGLPQSAKV